MINFDILKIDPEKGTLTISLSIPLEDTNKYLERITIDNQNTCVENGPSETPLYRIYFSSSMLETTTYSTHKNYKVTLSNKTLKADVNTDIFFVYVHTKDEKDVIKLDETVGVAYNVNRIYKEGMKYIKELNKCCSIPKNFIDFILKLKAIELNLNNNNYFNVAKYWNKFFNHKTITDDKCNTGCN